jgi:hypothetical protein
VAAAAAARAAVAAEESTESSDPEDEADEEAEMAAQAAPVTALGARKWLDARPPGRLPGRGYRVIDSSDEEAEAKAATEAKAAAEAKAAVAEEAMSLEEMVAAQDAEKAAAAVKKAAAAVKEVPEATAAEHERGKCIGVVPNRKRAGGSRVVLSDDEADETAFEQATAPVSLRAAAGARRATRRGPSAGDYGDDEDDEDDEDEDEDELLVLGSEEEEDELSFTPLPTGRRGPRLPAAPPLLAQAYGIGAVWTACGDQGRPSWSTVNLDRTAAMAEQRRNYAAMAEVESHLALRPHETLTYDAHSAELASSSRRPTWLLGGDQCSGQRSGQRPGPRPG